MDYKYPNFFRMVTKKNEDMYFLLSEIERLGKDL